jgi:hypothetical protein
MWLVNIPCKRARPERVSYEPVHSSLCPVEARLVRFENVAHCPGDEQVRDNADANPDVGIPCVPR